MKKSFNLIFWSFFLVLCVVLIFNNYVLNSKIYFKYKYGINYNNIRLEKSIPLLPEHFVYFKDDYYDNLIIWKNIEHKKVNSDSIYTHEEKAITVRNSEILLEKDLFKMKANDSIGYNLIKKYYYKENKNLSILEKYLNRKLVSSDTVFKTDEKVNDWLMGNN